MNAVATLLYNPDYLPGALVLGHTLRKIVDASTKLVVLVDSAAFTHLQLRLLHDVWDELVNVDMLESPLHTKLVVELKRPELAKTYLKVQLWRLPYAKVLYLDADTLPLLGDGAVTDLLKLDFPTGKIVAAPDSGFPDIFNSGVFALRPDEHDYNNLVALVGSSDDVSFDGADQGLLNQYFNSDPDWVSQLLASGSTTVARAEAVRTSNWVPVPFLYNTTPSAQYQYLPAFNYFGPESSGGRQPHVGSHGEAGQPEEQTGHHDEVTPALDTLHAYHGAAAAYFASGTSRSLVKLLHFIGPLKPWKGSNSGLFKAWWDAWYEYSGGRLIADTLFKQYYSISVKPLQYPGGPTEESETQHNDGEVVQLAPAAYPPPKEYTPADLCDPINYHQYAPEPESSVPWDATREEPPVEAPVGSSFNDDLKSYSNQWDSYEEELEKEVVEEVLEEKFVEEEVAEEQDEYVQLVDDLPQSLTTEHHHNDYGVHRDQRAERVFSESSDYMPLHYLLMKSEQVSEPAFEDKEYIESFSNLDINRADDDIDVFGDETEVEEDIEVESDVDIEIGHAVESGVPKLFPWEFRDDNYKPERSF